MKTRQILKLFFFMAAAILSGCGGGGSGSGVDNPLSVSVGPPRWGDSIKATTIVGEKMRDFGVNGPVYGNFQAMAGKTIYVKVEDPANLFGSQGLVYTSKTMAGADYDLMLYGVTLNKAGHFTGNLRVFACLDEACANPIAGTPISLPYDVTVLEPIGLSRDAVTVSVPFGTLPGPEMVDIALSTFSREWHPNHSAPATPGPLVVDTMQSTGVKSQDKQLGIVFRPAPPGNYLQTIRVGTEARLPDGRNVFTTRNITVNYNVNANPQLDVWFLPAALDITHQRRHSGAHPLRALPNTGVTVSAVRVEYLTWAGTQGPYMNWFQHEVNEVRPCDAPWYSENCLLPGVYTAQIWFRIVTPGGQREVAYPVRVTITE